MAYTDKEIETIFESILNSMESGESLRSILKAKNMPSTSTFYIWLDEDSKKSKRYARAASIRADVIFDEMFDIADDGTNDYMTVVTEKGVIEKLDIDHVQRSKLRIDTRKWALSKLNPKKYGDKIDLTTDGEKIEQKPTTVTFINARKDKKDK